MVSFDSDAGSYHSMQYYRIVAIVYGNTLPSTILNVNMLTQNTEQIISTVGPRYKSIPNHSWF